MHARSRRFGIVEILDRKGDVALGRLIDGRFAVGRLQTSDAVEDIRQTAIRVYHICDTMEKGHGHFARLDPYVNEDHSIDTREWARAGDRIPGPVASLREILSVS